MMDAVIELTAERSYEAARIADIVKRAAVARKTLYDNFDGKEALFLAAIESTWSEMKIATEAACEQNGGSPKEAVVAGLRAFLGFAAANPIATRVCMVEAISATPRSAECYERALQGFAELLRRSSASTPDLPPPLTEAIAGGVFWMLQQQLLLAKPEPIEELLPYLSEFVLAPCRSASPA